MNIAPTSEIAGFIGSCLVDAETGQMLASEGTGILELEAIAALNTTLFRSNLAAIEAMGLEDTVEDMLFSLGSQVHLLRPLEAAPSLFLYVALDRTKANLGLARLQVRKIERAMTT